MDVKKEEINESRSGTVHNNMKDPLNMKPFQVVTERIRADSEDSPEELHIQVDKEAKISPTQSQTESIRRNSEDFGIHVNGEGEIFKEDQTSSDEMNKKENIIPAMADFTAMSVDQHSVAVKSSGENTETYQSVSSDKSVNPADPNSVVVKSIGEAQPSLLGNAAAGPVGQVSVISNTLEDTIEEIHEASDTESETIAVEPKQNHKAQNVAENETSSSNASQKRANDADIQSLKEDECYKKSEESNDEQNNEECNDSIPASLSVSYLESESCESIEYPSDYSFNEDGEESIAVNVSFAPNFELLRLDKIMSWAQETFSWEAPETSKKCKLKYVPREPHENLSSFSQRSIVSSQVETEKSDLDSTYTEEENGFIQADGVGSPLMDAFVFYVEDTIDTLHVKTPRKAASFA
jgi:hypothetical protein